MRLLSLLALTLLSSSLGATTVQRFHMEDLAQNAERVFVGTCQTASTEQVDGQLFTRYRFSVTETLKGDARQHLEILLPGGEESGTRVRIPGMPAFTPGEELVLFLTAENRLGHAWPVGLAQGKFRIERRGAAKQARVYQDLDGLSFHTPRSAKSAVPSEFLQGLPLDQFLDQVRTLVAPPSSVAPGEDDGR